MRTAKDLYGEETGWFEYEPMIKEFGEIINKYDFGEYQGDTIVIYKSNNRYGYLLFGWGSCSGCDALQACETIEEVQKLMDALYNSIEWFNSLDELKEWFNQKDWGLEWFGHDPSFKDFTNEIRNL